MEIKHLNSVSFPLDFFKEFIESIITYECQQSLPSFFFFLLWVTFQSDKWYIAWLDFKLFIFVAILFFFFNPYKFRHHRKLPFSS